MGTEIDGLTLYLPSALVHESSSLGPTRAVGLPDPDSVGHAERMKSRVHPRYKTRYRVTNWREYEQGLVRRGDVTVWLSPDAVHAWRARHTGRRGAQPKFLDVAIETALTLRLVFHLPLRQAEGFLRSLFQMMEVGLEVPDHTTLSRRSADLKVSLGVHTSEGPIDLIIDSSGLAVVGEGEWAAAKHGGKGCRGWKKLHLGVDATGEIVAQVLTDSAVHDAPTGVEMVKGLAGEIASVTADSAYDTRTVYRAAEARGARVVIPPTSKASPTAPRRQPRARRGTIRRVKEVGRRRWKAESGYHHQGRVENTFFRYKTVIGDRLRARSLPAQTVEAAVACNVLNRARELGWPVSEKVPW